MSIISPDWNWISSVRIGMRVKKMGKLDIGEWMGDVGWRPGQLQSFYFWINKSFLMYYFIYWNWTTLLFHFHLQLACTLFILLYLCMCLPVHFLLHYPHASDLSRLLYGVSMYWGRYTIGMTKPKRKNFTVGFYFKLNY